MGLSIAGWHLVCKGACSLNSHHSCCLKTWLALLLAAGPASHALLVAVGSTLPRGWRPSGSRLARGGSPRSNRYRFEVPVDCGSLAGSRLVPGAALFRGCFADGERRVRSWLGSPSFDLSLSRLLHAWIKFRSSLFCTWYATGRFVAVLSDSPVLRVSGSLMAVAAGSDRGRSRVPSLPIPG